MIRIGEFQNLKIKREMPQGFYLEDEAGNEVLLPGSKMPDGLEIGDELEVFVYCDSKDLEIATTEKPYLTVGQYAYLKVTDVTNFGAFCNWGLSKDLFIPFSNQLKKLKLNNMAVVHVYLDEVTGRLVGSTKLRTFLRMEADEYIEEGEEVDLLVWEETDNGFRVVIDNRYGGMVYKNEVPEDVRPGQQLIGYIKPIREDGKIDVSLNPIGVKSIEPNAQKILEKLEANGGFLPFTDKSDPELIRSEFGTSKKLFKKSLGALYRQKLVLLKDDGIHKI